MRRVAAASSLGGPPGLGFKLTSENDCDMDNKKLTNVMDSANSSDVLNLKYYLSSRNNCGGSCLFNVGIPSSETDTTNKAYVDSTIRDSETSTRAYMNMLALDANLKTKFDSFTPQLVNIQKESPNSIKIAVEELTKETNIIIDDLKTQLYNLNKRIELLDKEGGEEE
ncbi:hypothetical protein FQA39_LY15681 [Lamprigera yunnana]|nr:hypothetical protein FQA39_LY15681 [Lamprigera yunnana]